MSRPFVAVNVLLVAGLVLWVGSRPASAQTLIDFETFPAGGSIPNDTQIVDQFDTLGVELFTSTIGFPGTGNQLKPGPRIRQALESGEDLDRLERSWRRELRVFAKEAADIRLYR